MLCSCRKATKTVEWEDTLIPPTIRTFPTGANRDTDTGKLDYAGFLSPVALHRFAQYMHKHRTLPDGSLRDSDNWKRGMPVDEYWKSLMRHILDLWFHMDKCPEIAREDLQEALCAIIFNAQGMLLEILKAGPTPQHNED